MSGDEAARAGTVASISPTLRIVRAEGRQRFAAAKRLLGRQRGDAQSATRLLEAAESHGIDMNHLWVSVGSDGVTPRQACLAVIGTGKASMLFTSAPESPDQERELAAVIVRCCHDLSGVRLAQALLEEEERAAKAALVAAGFVGVGSLAYMRRPTPRAGEFAPQAAWPDGIGIRTYRPGDDTAIIAAMDRSYERTLDCPELCGLRDTRDVFESHRATGQWNPKLWWMVERSGRVEGVLLFNPCPEQGSIELVYLGLAPALRGTGLARPLLEHGLAALAPQRERFVTCAVDERNTPARKLYARMGFADFARRIALVKPIAHACQ